MPIGIGYAGVGPSGASLTASIPTRDPALAQWAKQLAERRMPSAQPKMLLGARGSSSISGQGPGAAAPPAHARPSALGALMAPGEDERGTLTAYGTTIRDAGPRRALPGDPNAVAGGNLPRGLPKLPDSSGFSGRGMADTAMSKQMGQLDWLEFLRFMEENDRRLQTSAFGQQPIPNTSGATLS